MANAQPFPEQSRKTRRIHRFPSLRKLLELQEVMEKDGKESAEPRDRAMAVRVWRELEQLRMVKQGKPIAVEPAKLKLPKKRKLGSIIPLPDANGTTGQE